MRAFVLIDGRRGIKDSDEATMTALDAAAVSYAVVLTKRDEVKGADQSARIAATLEALRKRPAAYPEAFFTSARTGEGVAELRAHIAAAARRARPVDATGGRLRRVSASFRPARRGRKSAADGRAYSGACPNPHRRPHFLPSRAPSRPSTADAAPLHWLARPRKRPIRHRPDRLGVASGRRRGQRGDEQ